MTKMTKTTKSTKQNRTSAPVQWSASLNPMISTGARARRAAAAAPPLARALAVAIAVALLALMPHAASAQFAGGDGLTTATAFQIETVEQLQAMADHLDRHFVLIADIDASATAQWNDGAGFAPIGPNLQKPFTGSLDGRGHVITGLFINRGSENHIGLFGVLGLSGHVQNLSLEGVSIQDYAALTAEKTLALWWEATTAP